MASMFRQKCPSCDTMVLIKDRQQIGKKIDCPQCKYRFVVEEPQETDDGVEVVDESAAVAKGKKPGPAQKPDAAATKKPAAAAGPPAKGAPATKGPQPKQKADTSITTKDFDSDQARFKRKPKKESSGTTILVLGITVAICALGLLGVAAYFVFLTDTTPTVGPVNTGLLTPAGATTKNSEDEPPQPKGPQLVEITNLLPANTQFIFHFHANNLYKSLLGRAAFETPGAFQTKIVEERLGLKVNEVDDVVIAGHSLENWLFTVVRTRQPVNWEAIKQKWGLKPGEGSPIKNQEFFVTPPSAWLDNLSRIFTESLAAEAKVPPAKQRALAVTLVDPQTLILADPGPLKLFLQAPNLPKAASNEKATDRYQTVNASLKTVLDRAAAITRAPLVTFGCVMDAFRDPRLKALHPATRLKEVDPKLAALMDDVQALAWSVQLADRVGLSFSVDSRNSDLNNLLKDNLPVLSRNLVGSGATVEVNGEELAQGNGPKISIQSKLEDKTATVGVEIQLPANINTTLLEQVFQPNALLLRGMMEMASERQRLFELAGAAQAEIQKNKAFPRGTVERKAARFGRPYPPDQRLSWFTKLLPLLGYEDVAQRLNPERSWRPEVDPQSPRPIDGNARLGSILIPPLLDPSTSPRTWWVRMPSVPDRLYAATHFVGMAGVGLDAAEYSPADPLQAPKLGIFGYNRETRLEDVKDGLSNTILMIQVPPTYKRPWIAGGGATVQGVTESKSIEPFICRNHNGRKGTYALMADGSVRFLPADLPDDVFKAMCTINGGEKVDLEKTIVIPPPPDTKGQPVAGR